MRRTQAAPPIRLAHLGLGNFFRAHQAWYTAMASDAPAWGIAAFAGRSTTLADQLAAQDGLYTLITRSADRDDAAILENLSALHRAEDVGAWTSTLSAPGVTAVTITVTEAGYRIRGGGLDLQDAAVRRDLDAVRRDGAAATCATAPGRLVTGLLARQGRDAGPINLISCDNLPGNGRALGRVVREFAEATSPALPGWIEANVAFPDTMVDRITPATTDEVRDLARELTGLDDLAPVMTEPFSEWAIEDVLVGSVPDWASAGATLTHDVESFERRKLWLLNGGHSLLAYTGLAHGLGTVAEAMRHEECRAALEAWWLLAQQRLGLPPIEVRAYMAALVTRFENPRIQHRLTQIAMDGSQKVPARVLPLIALERAEGRMPSAAITILAAWVAHLRNGRDVGDARAADLVPAAQRPDVVDAVRAVLAHVDAAVADDALLVSAIASEMRSQSWA